MKKYFYALCMATALGTVGCSDDEVINSGDVIDPSLKTSISFSASDEAGGGTSTKALTKADDGFATATQIAARFVSTENGSTTNVRFTRTLLQAAAKGSGQSYSNVTYDSEYNRYWDDAFGRAAWISVYAIAVPGKIGVTNNGTSLEEQLDYSGTEVNATSNRKWHTGTENNTMSWTVSATNPSKESIDNEDLCYSNNIQADGKYGRKVWDKTNGYPDFKYEANATNPYPNFSDGMLSFKLEDDSKTEGPGHFDMGHMIFKHALSRVTLNIKAVEGFTPGEYAADKVKEVHLNNVPYQGTFDVQNGKWTTTATTEKVYLVKEETVESGFHLKYKGQIVPEYVIRKGNDNVNMLQFTINDNVYYVTDEMVHKALVGNTTNELDRDASDNIVMKPGKNYVLNITVNKTKIEKITATLADWLPVTGSHTQNNAYLTFENFVEKGSACTDFDLYRIPDNSSKPSTTPGDHTSYNWFTGYSEAKAKASLSQKGLTNVWEATNWFFDSNIHFYHFRTARKSLTTEIKPGTAPDYRDYFEIETGKDYHWGAPMDNDKNVPKYDVDKGYEDFIYYAIGATESTIKLQEFHMMSQVDIVLTTTKGLDKVSLYDEDTKTGTTVKITKIFKSGKVEMGRGLVSKTGDRSDYDVITPDQTSADTYYQTKPVDGTTAAVSKTYSSLVIPQALVEADVYVGLEIQTPDKNMYYVVQKLSEIAAGVTTPADDGYNHTNGEKIKRWYPGHHYTYTLTLKKTGIDKITCSLADWKKIEGSSDVTLES